MPGSYVKFLRGTESAFNKLTTKDNDTLYFVYTSNDASKGSLWLGNKQIVTGTDGSGSVTTEIDLGDLKNVLMRASKTKIYCLMMSVQKNGLIVLLTRLLPK